MGQSHTPGPWYAEVQFYDSSSYYIRGSDKNGNRLAWGKGAVAHIPRSTVMPMDANAELIATAPELLAALIGCLEYMDANCRDPKAGTYAGDRIIAARAAIAKATAV